MSSHRRGTFAFRLDVDSVVCLEKGVPNLLRLGERHGVRFTFFVNMGYSFSWRHTIAQVLRKRKAKGRDPGEGDPDEPYKLPASRKLGRSGTLRTVLLEVLSLNGNWLTGEIPPELGEVANLEVLNLRQNRLTGEIPPELGGLANLEVLSLRQNGLTGEIPPELGQLTNVKWLSLYINQLSGPIPPELLELEQVEGLVLGHNRLTGSIPPGLGSMRSLERLWLNDNRLTGAVPSELGDLRHQLEWLDFQENRNLSGPLPRELTNLTGLFRFEWGTTDLCSPPDREFQDWVYSVQTWYGRGPVCGS